MIKSNNNRKSIISGLCSGPSSGNDRKKNEANGFSTELSQLDSANWTQPANISITKNLRNTTGSKNNTDILSEGIGLFIEFHEITDFLIRNIMNLRK